MSTSGLIKQTEEQLSNPGVYQGFTRDLTEHHHSFAMKTLVGEMRMNDSISDKTAEYLVIRKPRTAFFYRLDQEHFLPPPGRPIVSPTDCQRAYQD